MHNKLLVLTALEETWGDGSEKLIFSGEWCIRYERHLAWEKRTYETISFHWDDREKFKIDYDYLESLHKRLLVSLSDYLNELHGVSYNIRYWQIILDPWLLSYVGIVFDRWETVSKIMNNHSRLSVIFLPFNSLLTSYLSWSDFMNIVIEDKWNQAIYQRILESAYLDKIKIEKQQSNNKPARLSEKYSSSRITIKKLLSAGINRLDSLAGKLFPSNKVAFVGSFFGFGALLRLNFSMRQFPRLYMKEFEPFIPSSGQENRDIYSDERIQGQINFTAHTPFESFIHKWLIKDLPSCVLEDYRDLAARVSKLKIHTEIIVTANPHWGNLVAKFWFAHQVNKGVKLVILEHGGSLPAFQELFDFEEDIADIRGTWFLPYHKKHRQVPPSKLVGFRPHNLSGRRKKDEGYLCLVGSEHPRYVYRAHFYPMAAQCLETFNLIRDLYTQLSPDVQEASRLKPYLNQGWNTRDRYADVMGAEKIITNRNLKQAMLSSRIIVCSYPETTFAEAMASDVPTILLYPCHLYERNPVAYPLMEILRSAKIIFTDSNQAALHINEIWNDPEKWWTSTETFFARSEFRKQALNLNGTWIGKWKNFLNEVRLSKSIVNH